MFFVAFTAKITSEFDDIFIKGVSRPNLQLIRSWLPKVKGHLKVQNSCVLDRALNRIEIKKVIL